MTELKSTPPEGTAEKQRQDAKTVARLLAAAGGSCPFGLAFFVQHLAGFVRDRCPDAADGLPAVQLHLHTGEVLDVCHVVAFSPVWVALAVNDRVAASGPRSMRTELVPFQSIVRVTVRAIGREHRHIGFNPDHDATLVDDASPEEALRLAATPATAVSLARGGEP